jgi:hypothetical protein
MDERLAELERMHRRLCRWEWIGLPLIVLGGLLQVYFGARATGAWAALFFALAGVNALLLRTRILDAVDRRRAMAQLRALSNR